MIKDFLFGKKKQVTVEGLGTFEARVKPGPIKNKSWLTIIKLVRYQKESAIILEGNSNGPAPIQIEKVKFVIANLEKIEQEVETRIYNSFQLKKKYPHFKISDLQLDCIYPWEEDRHSFELSYDFLSDESKGISVTVEDGEIIEIA